jgi:hypothetical protein
MIFINEKLDLNILNSFCKKSSKYNEVNNNKILKNIKPNNGLTSKTLYYWLKYDNIAEFNKLVAKAFELDASPEKIDELRQTAEEAQESRKPLTKEEVKELEFQAMKQQQKIDEFEFQTTLTAALVNTDLAIEKLTRSNKEIYIEAARIYKQMEEKKECTFKPKVN